MSGNRTIKTVDLLTLFEGIEGMPKRALDGLRAGKSARSVADEFIEPHIKAIEENAGQEMDAGYIAHLLEFVLLNSSDGKKPIRS
jgi:hypothetical protein